MEDYKKSVFDQIQFPENHDGDQSQRSRGGDTDRPLINQNLINDPASNLVIDSDQSNVLRQVQSNKRFSVNNINNNDIFIQSDVPDEKSKKKLSLKLKLQSENIQQTRNETFSKPQFSIQTSPSQIAGRNLKNLKLELNPIKDMNINDFEEIKDEFETARSDNLQKYINAKTDTERQQILHTHLEKLTDFGSLVNPRDLVFMDQFRPLKPTLHPITALNQNDINKRLSFDNLLQNKVEQICDWKQGDTKGNKKKSYIKDVVKQNQNILIIGQKDEMEKLESYEDQWPCLNVRKLVSRFWLQIHLICQAIIKHQLFENACITVISLNSMAMMFDDPTAIVRPQFFTLTDNVFLGFYTFEMVAKILGLRFFFAEEAYLKDPWNMMDMVIVGSAYLGLFTDSSLDDGGGAPEVGDQSSSSSFNLKGLRAFRVLRPLKTISTIKGLKLLVLALFSALPLLRDTIIILMFFFIIFAIAGTQIMSGMLKQRCIFLQDGSNHPSDMLCGQDICPDGYFCGKTNANPNFGSFNYDNIMYSFMQNFSSVVLEGWSDFQVSIWRCWSYIIVVYFYPLVFFGNFFFLNLTMAVINSKFTEANNKQQSEEALAKLAKSENQQDEKLQLMNLKNETNIFLAQNVAKQMIRFLRQRQAHKANKLKQSQQKKIDDKTKEIQLAEKDQQQQRIQVQEQDLKLEKVPSKNQKRNSKIVSPQATPILTQSQQQSYNQNDQQQIENPQQTISQSINQNSQNFYKEETGKSPKQEMGQAEQIQKLEFSNDENEVFKTIQNKLQYESIEEANKQKSDSFLGNIQMITPSHVQNNINSSQTLNNRMMLKMKGNFGLKKQFHLKKQFKEDEIIGTKTDSIIQDQLIKNQTNQVPKSFLADAFVIEELIFDKLIPQNKQITTHINQNRNQVLGDNEANGMNEYQKINSIKPQNFENVFDQSSASFDFQKPNEKLQEIPYKQDLIKDFGNYSILSSQNQQSNRSVFSFKEQAEENLLNEAQQEINNDQLPDKLVIEQSLSLKKRQYSSGSQEDLLLDQHYQLKKQDQPKISIKDKLNSINYIKTKNQIKNRMSLFVKNSQMIIQTPQNVSKVYRKLIQSQSNLSNRAYDTLLLKAQNKLDKQLQKQKEQEKIQEQFKKLIKKNNNEEEINQFIEDHYKRNFNRPIFMMNMKDKISQIDEQFNFIFELKKRYLSEDDLPITKIEEKISTQRPDDLFQKMDRKNEKAIIMKEVAYVQGSMPDLVEEREIHKEVASDFIQPVQNLNNKIGQGTFDSNQNYKNYKFNPFQLKVEYDVQQDSSELEDHVTSSEGEYFKQLVQPYQTIQGINYFEHLKQVPLKQITRRSDVFITSTLATSIFPRDKRIISNVFRVLMKKETLDFYINQRNLFKALCKEQNLADQVLRDKDKAFNDNYLRSFIYRQEFQSDALFYFKQQVAKLNSNVVDIPQMSQDLKLAIYCRHQQNIRATEKRGVPKLTFEVGKKIVEGKFHDGEEEDPNNAVIIQESESQKKMDQIKNAWKNESEIPKELRSELEIPENMQGYEINFIAVKKSDLLKKRFRTLWSGQDILPERLDYHLSSVIQDRLNSIRIWPPGIRGFLKRIRIIFRQIVFSVPFDQFFTFAVLINTIVLSLNYYGMPTELTDVLDIFNGWLTKIFIVELGMKLCALGVSKYMAERMNILDGFIVLISIFELIYEAIQSGNMNVSAFTTIRMFRTLRVLRIIRLLRNLSSMQTIMSVIARSYSQFIYITLLLFLFIFIFSLLGMQFFGGNMNYPETGQPLDNYDTFPRASITVFWILTLENFFVIFFDLAQGEINKYMASVFVLAWAFIGNFILLNLFLAILLDSFLSEAEEEPDPEEILRAKQAKIARKIERKKRKVRKIVAMSIQKEKLKVQEHIESEEDLEDLDEDQVIKIFQKEGLMKEDDSNDSEQKVLFVGIKCESSLYLFSKQNQFRIVCYQMIIHKSWGSSVMYVIAFSSLKLAVDTYLNLDDETLLPTKISAFVDYILNALFAFEMSTKIIAIGLIMDEGSYLTDSWNYLDFFIVMSSILDMSLSQFKIKFIKILRLLRTLRPLRVINHNVELKMIVVALMDSIGGISNVLLVVSMVWLIFAILGVNFYGGRFQFCSLDKYQQSNQQACESIGGQWLTYDQNFDDVLQAMANLFMLSTLENWNDVLFQAIQSTGVESGPQFYPHPENALYFIFYVLIGAFFFLNFFIGVLFLKYDEAQQEEKKGYTQRDLNWMDIQRLILQSEPEYESTNIPKTPFRKKFHDLVIHNRFEEFIWTIIVLNMFLMASYMESMPDLQIFVQNICNYIFTVIFVIELITKLIAFGGSYFKNTQNRFDFFVVCASLFDIMINLVGKKASWLSIASQICKILRVLRVTRLIKLFNRFEGLQSLIQTIGFSYPSLVNIFLLLMLVYFMFSVLAVFLFKDITSGVIIDEYKNFAAFLPSLMTLFAVSTGENWNNLVFDCNIQPPNCIEGQTCGTIFSIPYFFIFEITFQWVMFNLFVLVIIEQFEKYYLPKENMILLFKKDLINFQSVWRSITIERYGCLKMKENFLLPFFQELGEVDDTETSLGFPKEYFDQNDINKQILKMNIRSQDGFVTFSELLYRTIRRKYGKFKIGKKMQVHEIFTQWAIYQKFLENHPQKKLLLSSKDIYSDLIKKENGVNPFLTSLSVRISFKTWLKAAKSELKKRAIILLEKTGNLKMIDRSKLNDPPQKYTSVFIEQAFYFSETSEGEGQAGQISQMKSTFVEKKVYKNKHLVKFEKEMKKRIIKNLPAESPHIQFFKVKRKEVNTKL